MPKGNMIKIRLTKSLISQPEKHRKVVAGLGLTKVGSEVLRNDTPEVRGMVRKIVHMVTVEKG